MRGGGSGPLGFGRYCCMASGGCPTRRRCRPFAIAAAVCIAGAAFAACTGSGYSYVKSSSTRTYFKLPDSWKVYSRQDLIDSAGADALPSGFKDEFPFFVLFDGSRSPSIRHNDFMAATSPFGIARVRRLSADERDTFSQMSLRNEVVKIDELSQQADTSVEVIEPPKAIQLKNGVHGTKLVYTVRTSDGSSFSALQIGMTDASARRVWFLIIGCQVKCFSEHRRNIDDIAESWTIREK